MRAGAGRDPMGRVAPAGEPQRWRRGLDRRICTTDRSQVTATGSSEVWQARIGVDLAAELRADADVLGLDGRTEMVRAALRLLHQRAAEERMARVVDDFYEGRTPPLDAHRARRRRRPHPPRPVLRRHHRTATGRPSPAPPPARPARPVSWTGWPSSCGPTSGCEPCERSASRPAGRRDRGADGQRPSRVDGGGGGVCGVGVLVAGPAAPAGPAGLAARSGPGSGPTTGGGGPPAGGLARWAS